MTPTLLVFLGNPGSEYADTRHNVGFRVGERLIEQLGQDEEIELSGFKTEHQVKTVTVTLAERSIHLFFPQSFMNLSGEALFHYLNYHKVSFSAADLLLVRDELDLPVGTFRVGDSAGSSGHHGVESIQRIVGRDKPLWQVKIGISRNNLIPVDSYVLQRFAAAEDRLITTVVDKAAESILNTVIKQTAPLQSVTERLT